MKKLIINLLKFLVFFGIGFTILYFVFQDQQAAFQKKCDFDFVQLCIKNGGTQVACEAKIKPVCSLSEKVINDFKTVNFFWIFVVMLAFMLSNLSRAMRWNMLIHPLGYPVRLFNTFWATMAGYFANMALPRMGEVVKPGLVSRYEKVPLEKLMGTIVVDRILDVIMLASLIGLTFLLELDRIWEFVSEKAFQNGGGSVTSLLTNKWVLLILGLGVAGLLALFLFRKRLAQTALFAKLKTILLGFWDGILSIKKLENPGLFIFHTLFIWLMYYLMTYLCFFAFAPTANLAMLAGLTVFVFGGLGMVIPAPGGMGSYQYLVTQALILYAIDGDNAFSFSMIIFITVNVCNILFGILAFILLPIYNKQASNNLNPDDGAQ